MKAQPQPGCTRVDVEALSDEDRAAYQSGLLERLRALIDREDRRRADCAKCRRPYCAGCWSEDD